MGWKNIKEHFNITGHAVCVDERGICIGSGYVSNLICIDPETGIARENSTFSGFIDKYYPAIKEAGPEKILELIKEPDTFNFSLPVFTFENGEVIEKQCEEYGWPNVTHDGCMMFDNTFTKDKEKAIKWAKSNASSHIRFFKESIQRNLEENAKIQKELDEWSDNQVKLDNDYPEIPTPEDD